MLKKDNTMIAADNQTTVKEISKESVMTTEYTDSEEKCNRCEYKPKEHYR